MPFLFRVKTTIALPPTLSLHNVPFLPYWIFFLSSRFEFLSFVFILVLLAARRQVDSRFRGNDGGGRLQE